MAWIATALSLFGLILNAKRIIWCWPIWILANIYWVQAAYHKQDWPTFALWMAYSAFNVYGWYSWAKK